jgi:hypothetical protein
MNKLLMEENDRLQKQVSQLVYENSYFRQQTQNVKISPFSFLICFDLLKLWEKLGWKKKKNEIQNQYGSLLG